MAVWQNNHNSSDFQSTNHLESLEESIWIAVVFWEFLIDIFREDQQSASTETYRAVTCCLAENSGDNGEALLKKWGWPACLMTEDDSERKTWTMMTPNVKVIIQIIQLWTGKHFRNTLAHLSHIFFFICMHKICVCTYVHICIHTCEHVY